MPEALMHCCCNCTACVYGHLQDPECVLSTPIPHNFGDLHFDMHLWIERPAILRLYNASVQVDVPENRPSWR